MRIRPALTHDLTEVLAIERAAFDAPWDYGEFRSYLRRLDRGLWLAEEYTAGRWELLGFYAFDRHDDYLELADLAVHAEWRRRGVGALLVAHAFTQLTPRQLSATAAVCDTNLDAQLFFRALGFRTMQILPGHFQANSQDAYWFLRMAPLAGATHALHGGSLPAVIRGVDEIPF